MAKRTRYSADFKARVALDAICEELTLAELSKKHGVHPTMISGWKRAVIKNMAAAFDKSAGSVVQDSEAESLIQNYFPAFLALAMYLADRRIEAMRSHASADAIEVSQSFASLRQRPSHAKVRSTTQRRVMTTKPVTPAGRLTISIVGPLISRRAVCSLSPP